MIGYTTFMKHAEKVTKKVGEARPVLNGVHHAEDGDLIVTDSHRLYLAKEAQSQKDGSVICPKSGASIEGSYPDVSRLIPDNEPKMKIELDVVEALKASKALKACGQLADKVPMFRVEVKEGNEAYIGINNLAMSAEYRASYAEISDNHELIFNGQFLIDALEMFKDAGYSKVMLNTHGSMRPFIVKQDDSLMAILLPVRTY